MGVSRRDKWNDLKEMWKGLIQGSTHFKKKCRSHLKIQGTRRMICRMFHTEDPQILVAIVHSLVVMANLPSEICAYPGLLSAISY